MRCLAHRSLVAAAFALAAASCGTVELTPQEIARADAPEPVRGDSIRTWRDAIVVMNDYLASDFRRTLPPGRLRQGRCFAAVQQVPDLLSDIRR